MILVDFSGVLWSGLHGAAYSMGKNLDEAYFKHMMLNMLRSYRVKFHRTHGEMVLCMDGRNYWRKQLHPHYKSNRKKARDDNKMDMDEIFKWVDRLKSDLRESFPYKVIEVATAEADDIMAVLANKYSKTEKSIIVSADGDMLQCLDKNVSIYDPRKKLLREMRSSPESAMTGRLF